MKVAIIDYGLGNLGSVFRALEEVDCNVVLLDKPADLYGADRLILPGVGNFSDCAHRLKSGGWVNALQEEVVGKRKPLLGICVGMQLLADTSEEGSGNVLASGLGLISGRVQHLSSIGSKLRVPHIGWNDVHSIHSASPLFCGIPEKTDFYFVHSYAFTPDDSNNVVAIVDHGVPVTAAVQNGHIYGVQFHPEKSSRAGLRLLRNFAEGELVC